jgi:CRISPR-associated endonuclease/helicase Cas3
MPDFLQFWGKAQPAENSGEAWHPVAFHLHDVAATADALFTARPSTGEQGARLLGLTTDELRSLVVSFALIHDIGKFSTAFQAKRPDLWPACLAGTDPLRVASSRHRHTHDGWLLWQEGLGDLFASEVWPTAGPSLAQLALAAFGHHGRPIPSQDTRAINAVYGELGLAAATACVTDLLRSLGAARIQAPPLRDADARTFSWWLAGFLTVADWVGSHQEWFPYESSLIDIGAYHALAADRARVAVRSAGLVAARSSPLRRFSDLTPGKVPNPMQRWAESVDLPEGPTLFIVEDVTGSGKTEAAQMLVHRLMAAERANGAYWAMPTQATANAMYSRQGDFIARLFAPGALPSLVLAHGQSALHEGFRATVLGSASAATLSVAEKRDEDFTATAACTAFLADDRRASLLADVGAGTIDQALLAALPTRFNTVRLFGLAGKVLVVDEAHAYDAFMQEELSALLRAQASLGGSAVVLSATLTFAQRAVLVHEWRRGLGDLPRRGLFEARPSPVICSAAYPLATVVARGSGATETAIEADGRTTRRVAVRLVHTTDDAINEAVRAAADGAAVAWVRNTVDGCLDAAKALRARGADVLVYHARFAQGDRQTREAEVMRRFGPKATVADRRGTVLVATQVIEQSLDLDFDVMISDLAPVDLLIQRAGRLWRHPERNAIRPVGSRMELLLLAPEATPDVPANWLDSLLPWTSLIYAHPGPLWRTASLLADAGCIETPSQVRELVERVYEPDESDLPPALTAAALKAAGQQRADAAIGRMQVIEFAEGFHGDGRGWTDDQRVATRLDSGSRTLRLGRMAPNGRVVPWRALPGPDWKSWALSEVRVSSRRVPPTVQPPTEWARAVDEVRAAWGRFEQDLPLLVLQVAESGWSGQLSRSDGKAVGFTYDNVEGLRYAQGGEPGE